MEIFSVIKVKKLAFTLAEVLITLAIIGVVASLTIPSLIHNYRIDEINNNLKKTYAALSNAKNLAIKDCGAPSGWNITGGGTTAGTDKFLQDYVFKYLDVKKYCKNGCEELVWNGKVCSGKCDCGNQFILANGVTVKACLRSDLAFVNFTIDANGAKKPNKSCYDQFDFIYTFDYGKLATAYGLTYNKARNFCGSKYSCNGSNKGYCPTGILLHGLKIPTKKEFKDMGCDPKTYPW